MNPEIKEKWIAALKSGKYRRATGRLVTREGETPVAHCCLGVLCDIHKEITGEGYWEDNSIDGMSYTDQINTSARVLPIGVRKWAGIDYSNGMFNPDEADKKRLSSFGGRFSGERTALAEINDASTKEDFSDVIPFIEKYF